jgi:hypothetical protein
MTMRLLPEIRGLFRDRTLNGSFRAVTPPMGYQNAMVEQVWLAYPSRSQQVEDVMRLILTVAVIAASIAGSALASPDAPVATGILHFRPGPEWRAYWVCARRATKVMTNKDLSAQATCCWSIRLEAHLKSAVPLSGEIRFRVAAIRTTLSAFDRMLPFPNMRSPYFDTAA